MPRWVGTDGTDLLFATVVRVVRSGDGRSVVRHRVGGRFTGIELGEEEIPDETTILNFRHLLEKHQLTEKLLEKVNGYLSEKKLLLKQGTMWTPH